MTIATPPAARAGRKEWTALAVLALPLLLVSMDVSVLYFAVPFISQDLDPSATEQLWIFDIYGFVLAGLLLTMGALGDRIGRRRLLLIGAAGFSAASLLAAYSSSAAILVIARAVLGIAGATLMPSTLALLRSMFTDDGQRSKAIAIWTGVMTGGIALGPVLSGILLEHFWWGSVFLINLPAMALLLVLGPVLVPEFRPARRDRFDLVSSVLSLATVLPVIYGIKEWAAEGFAVWYPALIVVGVAIGLVFLARQRSLGSAAMLDLSLLSRPGFGGSVAANLMATFGVVGNAVFVTQFLQSVLGYSPLTAALWSVLPSVAIAGITPAVPALAARLGRPRVMAGGFVVAAAGFGVLAMVAREASLLPALVGASVLAIGLVAVMTLVTDLALGLVQPERAGAASAVLETGSEFGGALGIALLGSIGAAVYTHRMAGVLPVGGPAGLPDAAREAAGQTLGGAIAVAQQLPGSAGEALVASARSAFVSGMATASWAGAGLMLAAAALCWISLRRSTAAAEPAPVTA
ncbi:MAG TPA: MFS transporter [Nakamurella sp.]|nr:MFS transporter [Nakamurella sp.]